MGIHHVIGQAVEVILLGLNQKISAVQSHPAIVTDNTAAAVSIRQAGDDVAVTGLLDVGGIDVKHTVVVGLAILEDLLHLGVHLAAVGFQRLSHHTDAAKGHNGALQGSIGLQTNDDFLVFVDITGCISVNVADGGSVHIQHAAGLTLFFQQNLHFVPQLTGALGGRSQKALVPIIGSVVALDKILHVNGVAPVSADKLFHSSVFLSPVDNRCRAFCSKCDSVGRKARPCGESRQYKTQYPKIPAIDSSLSIQSITGITLYSCSFSRTTTRLMPALIIRRLHMEQEEGFST